MFLFQELKCIRNASECGITGLGLYVNCLTPKNTIEILETIGNGVVGGHEWMGGLAKHLNISVYNMQCDLWHPIQDL